MMRETTSEECLRLASKLAQQRPMASYHNPVTLEEAERIIAARTATDEDGFPVGANVSGAERRAKRMA